MGIAILPLLVSLGGALASAAQAPASADTVRRVASVERVRVVTAAGSLAPEGIRLAVLNKTIAVDFDDVSLLAALEAIAAQAGLHLVYGDIHMPSTPRVSIHAASITVEAALLVALQGSRLDALVAPKGAVLLVPSGRRQSGRIEGHVTDAKTGAALAQASVTVDGTTLGATTRLDGGFRIDAVPIGTHQVIARRLGYGMASQTVVVAPDSVVRVELALPPAPYVLQEVVTTVTGDRERLALGNMIGTIRTDSLVERAPVTSLSDVISARVPGVQVFNAGGLVGASPNINIRGQNSLSVSNQPLLYIDGVRVENSSAGYPVGEASSGVFNSGRFNDLVPEEIESIEIVKGPSAATLYGTDAANGVILVRTKGGRAGRREWTAYAEQGLITFDRNRLLDAYHGWGHTTGGTPTPVTCGVQDVASGYCRQDSVTHFNPAKVPGLTPVSTGSRAAYGLQLAGGTSETRYFLSGAYEGETGYLDMPSTDLAILEKRRGAISVTDDNTHPNAANRYSTRDNLATSIGPDADLSVDAGYSSGRSRIPIPNVFGLASEGPGYRDANDGWFALGRPANFFADQNDESVSHFTGGSRASWRPLGWLSARAAGGIDFSSEYFSSLVRPGDEPYLFPTGFRGNTKTNVTLYSVDLGATALFGVTPWLTSTTSMGAQYNRRQLLINSALATGLSPGGQTVAAGAIQTDSEGTTETVVAGAYVEQTMNVRDRLFVSGAARVDGASAFGTLFTTAVYPKASASWIVSREPFWPLGSAVGLFRLRAAYGASGVQPGSVAALAQEQMFPVFVDGQAQTGVTIGAFGNPKLKPERQRELEAGFDADVLDARLHLEATYYDKKSSDALYSAVLAPSVSGGTQTINVGAVRNWGYEALADLAIVRTRPVSWNIQLNGSVNHNLLETLGPGYVPYYGSFGYAGVVPGYPLNAFFALPITHYADANHDGIIEPNEVTVGTKPVFVGQTYPKTQATVGSTVGLFGDRVHLAVLFDHRGGFRLWNQIGSALCELGTCRAAVDPHASLKDQAEAVVASSATFNFNPVGFYDDGSFTRLREVSVTYTLPVTAARYVLGARSLSITVSGRNLALWTAYRGVDPEVQTFAYAAPVATFFGAFFDAGSVPSGQYWIARINVGL